MTDKALKKRIPGEKSKALHERRNKAVPKAAYNVTPIYAKYARGAVVTDVDGNEIIDFAGGIGMQNVGHSHPMVVKAVQEQAEKSLHTSFHVFPYESYIELAEKINDRMPGDFVKKTMFINSGAEAIENAVKIARQSTGRKVILSFNRGYHGRTLMAMSLTSRVKPFKFGFGPFAPEVYKIPFPYYYRAPKGMSKEEVDAEVLSQIEEFFLTGVAAEEVAAILMEPVQGEGGIIVPTVNFVRELRKLCDNYGILLIADEIQTGFGRTGTFFGMEHYGVAADLVTTSKSIAAGLPLSAVTGRAEFMDSPLVGQLGGTFAGSPLSCVAGLAVIDILEKEKLLERSVKIGSRMNQRFEEMKKKYRVIGDVRGLGAMTALELVSDREKRTPHKNAGPRMVELCYQRGLAVLNTGINDNVLRFLLPLVTTDEQLEKGLDVIEESINEIND